MKMNEIRDIGNFIFRLRLGYFTESDIANYGGDFGSILEIVEPRKEKIIRLQGKEVEELEKMLKEWIEGENV